MLAVSALRAYYGRIPALFDVSFDLDESDACLLLGPNGAGKSTILRALSGLVRTEGQIEFAGRAIERANPVRRVRLGLAHVPEGRHVFKELSVRDNLLVGGYLRRGSQVAEDVDRWLTFFPSLAMRISTNAGDLSGGEQQMLAVARGLMSQPKVLLLDEPSLGLAPKVVEELFSALREIRSSMGVSMLIAEQNLEAALGMADRAIVLRNGSVAGEYGDLAQMKDDADFRAAYFGEGAR